MFGKLLEYYNDRPFVKEDGSFDMTTNNVIITRILEKDGFIADDKFQEIQGLSLYPTEYFCPLNGVTGKLNITKNSATIHWFSNTWASPSRRFVSKIARLVRRIFGENCLEIFKKK